MALKSLPVRERGLKLRIRPQIHPSRKSLPVRERGLKFQLAVERGTSEPVAPRAGAWIEIHTRASQSQWPASLPVRERGLK